MIKTKITHIAALVASVTLFGCAGSNDTQTIQQEIEWEQDSLSQRMNKYANTNVDDKQKAPYSYHDTFDVLGNAVKVQEHKALPAVFNLKTSIASEDKQALEEILEKLNHNYQSYGVVITVSADAANYLTKRNTNQIATESNGTDDSTGSGLESLLPIQSIDKQSIDVTESSKYNYSMKLNVRNTSLRNILDLIAANTDLYWRYENGRVTLYRQTEKTIMLDMTDQSFAIASGQSEGSGYSVSTKTDETNALTQAEQQIKAFLSEDGQVVLNTFDRSVTIKDTPTVIANVEDFLKKMNYRANTSYTISTEVYEVISEITDDKNIDWALAFETGEGILNLAAPAFIANANAGSIGMTVVNDSSRFNGSSAIAKFINRNASLSSVIKNTAKTKNNIPTPLVTTETRAIVTGRSVTIDSNGFSQQSTETKLIDEGFTISSRPRLLSNGKVDLEVIVNTKQIKNVETFGTEEEMVQLEEDRSNRTIGTVSLRSGETSLLNAYERELSSADVTALAKEFPWWAGGGKSNRRFKANVLIFVQPVVMAR